MRVERPEQVLADRLVRADDVVLELGARYGTVSCAINRKLANKLNQVSVEPDSTVWESLEKNIARNGFDIRLWKGFVSSKKMSLTDDAICDGYGKMSFIDENSETPTITLEELQTMFDLRFNVLIADCEGFLEQFFDENPLFLQQLRIVIFEADMPQKCNYDNVRKALHDNGFQPVLQGHQNVFIKNATM